MSKTETLVILQFPATHTATMRIIVADTKYAIDGVPCVHRDGEIFFSCQDWERAEYMVAQNLVERKIVNGETFRYLRKTGGWSLRSLARVLLQHEGPNYPEIENTIRGWEGGRIPVDLAVWEMLAESVKKGPHIEDPELTNAEAMAEVQKEE